MAGSSACSSGYRPDRTVRRCNGCSWGWRMKATPSQDALYFRVSSDRQTTENQFDELLSVAHKDGAEHDWNLIRSDLGRSIVTEIRTTRRGLTRTVYRVDAAIAERLAKECIYVEQGRSS